MYCSFHVFADPCPLWLWGMHRIAAQGMTDLPQVVILLACTLIASILPVLVTGGIHVDGFMDTSDAFHSWADRGKKLQILSDPHIGAFSVISLMILAAVWVSAVAVVAGSGDSRYFGVFALEYVLARALSGLAAVLFKNARGEGTRNDAVETGRRMCGGDHIRPCMGELQKESL